MAYSNHFDKTTEIMSSGVIDLQLIEFSCMKSMFNLPEKRKILLLEYVTERSTVYLVLQIIDLKKEIIKTSIRTHNPLSLLKIPSE